MDYMYGQLYKQIKEIEYKGRNSETTVVTVDQKTKTIRVDVKILSPEQLPKDEGNYVLLVEIDENGNHTLKWVSTQSTLDRIKELEDKTYKLTYNKDADTSTFDSNITINKDLNVEGNAIFNNKVTVLNPPVDATDATNREYVDDSIKAHFTSLNIENSTGNSSLRQKYSVNDVDYGAVATGENAAAFGGKRWDTLTDSSKTPTSAEGKQSLAAGGSVHAIGDFSAAFGQDTIAEGDNSFTANQQTKATGKNSSAFGLNTKAGGAHSAAFGAETQATAAAAIAEGYKTIASGLHAHAGGQYTEAAGADSVAYGKNAYANAERSFALGHGILVNFPDVFAAGKFNALRNDVLFQIGNGTDLNNRRDAFRVLRDGRAKVQTAPKESNDVVRLQEINDLENVYVRRYKAAVINERRAYIVKPDGYDFTLPIHTTALGDDLPIRTNTGQLKATDGVADDDLATIKQLNEGLNAKLDKVAITSGKFQAYITGYDENGSKQLMVDLASDTSGNSIARRDNNGRLQAAAGAVADDVATFGQLGYINNVLQANIDKKIDLVEGDTTIALKNNSTISYTSSTTASTIMQRDSSGRVKVEDGINNKDAVNKGQLDTKLDLTGGTLTGNLTIQDADVEITKTAEGKGNLTVGGNLRVNGTTTTVDTETLAVKDNLIIANADNTELVNLSGLAIKTGNKDADENAIAYGILYDPATSADSVKLGLGSINKTTNEFTFKSATDANPVATRDDSTKLTNNHLLVWNSAKHTLIDANNLVNSITPASLGLNNFVLDGGEIVA